MVHVADRGPTVFVVSLVTVTLATVFTLLRFISKWGITKKSNADDYSVIVAWVFTLAMGVSVMIGAQNGSGKHDEYITPDMMESLKRSIYAFTIFYNPALMATKSAILLSYLRMATAHPFLKIASLFVLAIVNLSGIVLTFLNIFQCRPVAAAFTDIEGRCIDLVGLYLSSAPVNVLTDLAILLSPSPILTASRMEFRQKVVLVATFIVGGFVTIVDVIRIVYSQNASQIERAHGMAEATVDSRPPGFIYEVSFTLMWSTVEVSVGLICACVLVLKPLVMRVMPSMLRRRRRSSVHHDVAVFDRSKSPRSPTQRRPTVLEDPRSVPTINEEDSSGPMDFMEMLAMDEVPPSTPVSNTFPIHFAPPESPERQPRRLSRRSTIFHRDKEFIAPDQQPTQTFFDFVEMGGRKPLTESTAKEAWWPVLFVSTLFFLWGFAYGLSGTLNGEIQALMKYSPARSIALHSSYWIAYFFSPLLIGYWTLTRSSFKSTFIAGLVLYAIGALSFWPSSVLLSYPGFFISNFLIASGLACLEVAGNPFIALAGPLHLSESRLNFSQGIQAVGSVLSPILARQVLFKGLDETSSFNVQWCYLTVAFFVIALAVVFYYVPSSEAPDDVLEATSQQASCDVGLEATAESPFLWGHVAARTALMVIGVTTMAIYVGAQETVSYFFSPVSQSLQPNMDPFWVQAIAHAVFASGRFLASSVTFLGSPPRYVLLACSTGAFITSLLSFLLPPGKGTLASFILVSFFESAIFPTSFAITLRNQGARTKLTSAASVAASAGGALFPGVAYGACHAHPTNQRYSLSVVAVLFGVSLIMPGWLCGGMKYWVDPVRPRRAGSSDSERSPSDGATSPDGKRESSHIEEHGTHETAEVVAAHSI